MDPKAPPAVTAAEMREMDRVAIEEFGVPGVVLMENAGAGAAHVAATALPEGGRRVALFAGRGNNGGDAFVVARHLANRGIEVDVTFVGNLAEVGSATDAGINLFILLKSGILVREVHGVEDVPGALAALADVHLVVDGLLGTGARGTVREPHAALIEGVNALPVPVVALDLPSGLDADTGEILGSCIQAAHTATFGLPKKGFALARGPSMCGTVHIVDIGMPRVVVDKVLAALRRPPEGNEPAPAEPTP